LSWQITCLAWGSSARAALVGKALRVARSNNGRSSSASSWAIAMLTAEGTAQLAGGGGERAGIQHREEYCQGVAGKGHCQ
jgi:hypothetical protein